MSTQPAPHYCAERPHRGDRGAGIGCTRWPGCLADIERSPEYLFTNDQPAFRLIERVDVAAAERVAIRQYRIQRNAAERRRLHRQRWRDRAMVLLILALLVAWLVAWITTP